MKIILLLLVALFAKASGGILDQEAPMSFRSKTMSSSEALYLVRGWIEGAGDATFEWKGKIPKKLRTHEIVILSYRKNKDLTFRAVLEDALSGSDYRLHFVEEQRSVRVTFLRKMRYNPEGKWFKRLEKEGKLTSGEILSILEKKGWKFSSHFSVKIGRGDPFAEQIEKQGGRPFVILVEGLEADIERFNRFLKS